MTQKEKLEIGLSMAVLMDSILQKESSAEDVANTAINIAKDLLNRFSELRTFVDDIMCEYSEHDEDFDRKWDRKVAWIEWEKRMLNS